MLRNIFGQNELLLSDLELAQQKRKKKRLIIIAISLVILLGLALVSARPAINAVRGWQARRHAGKAFVLIDQQKWSAARDEAIAGYQLRSNEPEAIPAVARLFSRAGQPDGLKFWHDLGEHTRLTRTDLRDEAGLALHAREFDTAGQAIKELLSDRDGGPVPGDWLLAAQLALQEQDLDSAAIHVRQVFASGTASEADQFQATLLLDSILRAKGATDLSEVFSRLDALARGTSNVSLEALVALAQRIENVNPGAHESDALSTDDIIHRLETHPLAAAQHKLLAIDLKMHEHPEEKDDLIKAAVNQYKKGPNESLIALANWLNSHQEYQKELDAIPRERAMQTRELFFQHVDALGALGRWDEIRRLIESEQFPLDPVIEHMYLARCYAQQGQKSGAENNWGRALQAAAGDMSKLMTLGDYAEKNGAVDVAAAAYDAAVAVSPKSRPAQQGRLRTAYAARDTKKIHDILADLLKLWPNDAAVQNDEAYTRLLLLGSTGSADQLRSIAAVAEKLVAREPASLPHRTLLALVRLKQNRPADALSIYSDIKVPKSSLTTSSVVVHAAVIAANGHPEEAKAEVAQIPEDKLLPEEKAFEPK